MNPIPLLAESPAALDALARCELLYTDLDGTLLGIGGSLFVGGEGEPSLQAAEAIVALNGAGLTTVITTGRNRIQAAEISRLLGWRGFIAEIGCVMVPDRGADPIYCTGDWPEGLVPPGDTPYCVIERAGALPLLERTFPGRIEPHAPYHLNREATVMLRGQLDLAEAQAVLDTLDVPVEILDNGIVHPVRTGLVGVTEIHAYHLLPPGVRKPTSVAIDANRRGVPRERVVAIGDSATDVGMADVTGLTVLVANALEDAHVLEAARSRDNVFAVDAKRGDGWARFARLWLEARGA